MELQVEGRTVLFDDEDAVFLGDRTWRIGRSKKPYFVASTSRYVGTFNGKHKVKKVYILFHRLVMNCPDGMCVDHINGNGLDNRKCNLRICTNSENHLNTRMPRHNTSGYKGVSFCKNRNKWESYISVNNKKINIGRFNSAEEAYKAYCDYGEYIRGEYFSKE